MIKVSLSTGIVRIDSSVLGFAHRFLAVSYLRYVFISELCHNTQSHVRPATSPARIPVLS